MRAQSILRAATVIIVVTVLHLDLSTELRVFGVAAELPLACAVAGALSGGVKRGCLFGFASGLVVDMFMYTPVGFNALIYSTVGWVFGHIYSEDLLRRPFFVSILTGLGSALALGLFSVLAWLLGEVSTGDTPILKIVFLASLLNTMWGYVLVRIGTWMWALDPLGRRGALR